MRIAFWQNMPTHHQAATLRSLAEFPDVSVTVITESNMPQWRIDCGWAIPDYGAARLVIAADAAVQKELLEQVGQFDVHVFSGIRAYPFVRRAFRRSCTVDTVRGVMAESADWRGWRGTLRKLEGRLVSRRYRDRISFILAIGALGEMWYGQLGYPKGKIYRYGYFVEADGTAGANHSDSSVTPLEDVELIYVGRLVRLKGLDVLLAALAQLKDKKWRLTLVGEGPASSEITALALRLGLKEKVRFVGALSNSEAMSMVSAADLLVLPSFKDGWGAVTNEALMRGVPVVCSDRCGSADLLGDAWRGTVFRAGDDSSLRSALLDWIDKGPRTAEERRKIRAWSARIEPRIAAEYILSVVSACRHHLVRPDVPWLGA